MTSAQGVDETSLSKLFGNSARLFDLSQEISKNTQVHPLHPRVEVYPYETHPNSKVTLNTGFSFSSSLLIMSDHAATHVDSISHMSPDPGAPTIDQMPLSTFCGDAVCLDLSHKEPRSGITISDLQESLESAQTGLVEDDIVLLYTGHFERTAGTDAYLDEFPGLEPESARWLIDNGVKLFGNQAMSVDVPGRYDFPVHQVCAQTGVTHLENVGRLQPLAGKRFTLFGFPLKIIPGTGSPIRLVGAIQE